MESEFSKERRMVVAYQALYREWRSQTFDTMIGQQMITQTLKMQLFKIKCPMRISLQDLEEQENKCC